MQLGMVGGEIEAVQRLDPIFNALAPGVAKAPRTPGRTGEPRAIRCFGTGRSAHPWAHRGAALAENGYLHCGPNGGGHFVIMVHNGIEYGIMAPIAEGLNIIKNAGIGNRRQEVDAETSLLRHPGLYPYEFHLPDVAEVSRCGCVIGPWLLDLTASALYKNPDLAKIAGRVSDWGEGRWTLRAAVDEGVPARVISSVLFSRFSSRGMNDFADKILSAMRYEFGGHLEKTQE
jgi:6-phosphogluconate dehydrogenase